MLRVGAVLNDLLVQARIVTFEFCSELAFIELLTLWDRRFRLKGGLPHVTLLKL